MKTAISLPDPLHRAADALAARLGISRSALFQRAVERLLKEHDDESVTAALNRVYSNEAAVIDPALATMQAAALPDEAW